MFPAAYLLRRPRCPACDTQSKTGAPCARRKSQRSLALKASETARLAPAMFPGAMFVLSFGLHPLLLGRIPIGHLVFIAISVCAKGETSLRSERASRPANIAG